MQQVLGNLYVHLRNNPEVILMECDCRLIRMFLAGALGLMLLGPTAIAAETLQENNLALVNGPVVSGVSVFPRIMSGIPGSIHFRSIPDQPSTSGPSEALHMFMLILDLAYTKEIQSGSPSILSMDPRRKKLFSLNMRMKVIPGLIPFPQIR